MIKALANATEPSLKGARYWWNGEERPQLEDEMFRNSLVHSMKIVSTADFEDIAF